MQRYSYRGAFRDPADAEPDAILEAIANVLDGVDASDIADGCPINVYFEVVVGDSDATETCPA